MREPEQSVWIAKLTKARENRERVATAGANKKEEVGGKGGQTRGKLAHQGRGWVRGSGRRTFPTDRVAERTAMTTRRRAPCGRIIAAAVRHQRGQNQDAGMPKDNVAASVLFAVR